MMTSMKITHSVRYDASVQDVYTMLSDPAFREQATRAQGATHVEVRTDGGRVDIDFRRPNDDVPAFARKFAGGDELTATQSEEWADDDYSATLSIATKGVPAGIRGTRTLVAHDDGTEDRFDGEAVAKIPVVGGKIEQILADKLREGWDLEHVEGTRWLEGS